MDVCGELSETVGIRVGKPKSGVGIESTGAGDNSEEGVNAWSVPSRSGVGVEAGLKSPQPRTRTSTIIHNSRVLFVICLD